jgi:hypothetical protein
MSIADIEGDYGISERGTQTFIYNGHEFYKHRVTLKSIECCVVARHNELFASLNNS